LAVLRDLLVHLPLLVDPVLYLRDVVGLIVNFPFSHSYSVHMPVSTASFDTSMVLAVSCLQPVGHGANTWMYLNPLIFLAFSNLLMKSWMWATVVVAT
jgi:hypothetical protein